jgi:hypothetical protein
LRALLGFGATCLKVRNERCRFADDQHWPMFGTQTPAQPTKGKQAPTQHLPEPQQSD